MYGNGDRKTAEQNEKKTMTMKNSPNVENYCASSKMKKNHKIILETFSKYFLKVREYWFFLWKMIFREGANIWYPSLYLQYMLGGHRRLTQVGGCIIMSLMYKSWGTCTHNTTILLDNAESCVKISLMRKPRGIWQITQKDCVINCVIKSVPYVQAVRDCTITQQLFKVIQKIVLSFPLTACTWHDNAKNCIKFPLTACTWE